MTPHGESKVKFMGLEVGQFLERGPSEAAGYADSVAETTTGVNQLSPRETAISPRIDLAGCDSHRKGEFA